MYFILTAQKYLSGATLVMFFILTARKNQSGATLVMFFTVTALSFGRYGAFLDCSDVFHPYSAGKSVRCLCSDVFHPYSAEFRRCGYSPGQLKSPLMKATRLLTKELSYSLLCSFLLSHTLSCSLLLSHTHLYSLIPSHALILFHLRFCGHLPHHTVPISHTAEHCAPEHAFKRHDDIAISC